MSVQMEMTEGARNSPQSAPDPSLADDTSSDAQLNVAHVEDIPPDGGYGWVCTACVFLTNANTWGVNGAWGVFLARYLSESTFPDASPLKFALIGGLSISQALFISPVVALVIARFGERPAMIIGAVLLSASLLGSSFATRAWHLFLTQGVGFGFGMGFLYITASGILPAWFSSRRSLAVGIASSGSGFGGLAYNLGAGAGVRTLGLARTYQIFAISTFIVNVCAAALLQSRRSRTKSRRSRTKSRRPPQRYFDARELLDVSVLLIILWGTFCDLGYISLTYSLPAYAESIGLSIKQGSVVGAILNLGQALGRPLVGWTSDQLGRINIATTATALCGVFCFALWIPAQSYGLLLAFAFAAGLVIGCFWGCVMPVTAEVVGLQRMPAAFAVLCVPLVIPATFAEVITLQITSKYGYLASQGFVGAMYVAGTATSWALRAWKMNQLEEQTRMESNLDGVPCAINKRWPLLRSGHWFHPKRV